MQRSRDKIFLAGAVLATILLWFWLSQFNAGARQLVQTEGESQPSSRPLLIRQLLKQQHEFVPASDSGFEYGGRWEQYVDRPALTSTSGSYIDFAIDNTTSLYVSAYGLDRHTRSIRTVPSTAPDEATTCHSRPRISGAGNVIIELDGQVRNRYSLSRKIIKVTSDLNPMKTHHVRILFFLSGTLTELPIHEFGGVWLGLGGHLVRQKLRSAAHLEAVVSMRADTPDSYPALLAAGVNMSHTVLTAPTGLLRREGGHAGSSLQQYYFGSASEELSFGSDHSRIPSNRFGQRFEHTPPSVILLELGATDVKMLLSRKLTDKPFGQAMNGLVNNYKLFIKAIRSSVHEYQSEKAPGAQIPGIDTSFAYNSVHDTMPIFLMTSFGHSVQLKELSNHVLSRTAHALRAEGDLSTIWVDTDGWLTDEDLMELKDCLEGQRGHEVHLKIASSLSYHLCPFLRSHQGCTYPRASRYDGNLYLPTEAGLGKLLEERKLQLIKERISGLTGTLI